MKKKKWSKPKLTILMRGTPEERVLSACKGGGWENSNMYVGGCAADQFFGCTGNCAGSRSS